MVLGCGGGAKGRLLDRRRGGSREAPGRLQEGFVGAGGRQYIFLIIVSIILLNFRILNVLFSLFAFLFRKENYDVNKNCNNQVFKIFTF